MGLGKQIRLNRIFSHPSGRMCSVAVDHFTIYNIGLPPALANIAQTVEAVVEGEPDAITMHKGIALSVWPKFAGRIPLILQSSGVRPDDSAHEQFGTIEDAVRLGADAFAVVAFVRGATEAQYLRTVADCVRKGIEWEMPVICHVYPRDENLNVIYDPEHIAWAVRCILEVGADIIKVPYCGDLEAHRQIVAQTPVPVVAAGGPKTATFRDALAVLADAVEAGVVGGTVGRNVWSHPNVAGAVQAYKAVIHDGKSADEAMELVGISEA